MAKRGKRYDEISQKVDKMKVYTPEEALELIFDTKSAKFVETVELAVRLGVDPRHADQQVRGTVVLPPGTGKTVKILTITSGENVEKALKAGSDFAGDDEYIAKIQGGWMDFDLVIATHDMMPKPKSGTVTTNVESTVSEFKKGKIAFKVDKLGSIHLPIGKVDFSKEAIVENFKVAIDQIIKLKPEASKGQYLRTVAISLTMGPGIKIEPLLVGAYSAK